jgi:regulator of cell morphogenesis and NO signaling
MSQTIAEVTVGQLVVERPSRARVFERLGIDFCCGGKKPLTQACREKGLDPEEVLRALDEGGPDAGAADVSSMTLIQLCDHIEQTHHALLKAELPHLEAISRRVAGVHGEAHPWTLELAQVLSGFAEELGSHMFKEERILFPWIRALEAAGGRADAHCAGSISNPIRMMEYEHDAAGQALARMRELSGGFAPPAGACNTFIALLDGVARVEADMHQHVHKENNILFPRAAALERSAS